jgi:DNA invertase Pin-like site-specific DNA recombinase
LKYEISTAINFCDRAVGGRPKALNRDKRKLAIKLYNEGKTPITKICSMMGISKPTLYNYLKKDNGSGSSG